MQRPRPACEADLGFGPGATPGPTVRGTAVCRGAPARTPLLGPLLHLQAAGLLS